jgi:hypothetical protein
MTTGRVADRLRDAEDVDILGRWCLDAPPAHSAASGTTASPQVKVASKTLAYAGWARRRERGMEIEEELFADPGKEPSGRARDALPR